MTKSKLLVGIVFLGTAFASGCAQNSGGGAQGTGGSSGSASGGSSGKGGAGGTSASGGTSGSGGTTAAGGSSASGGTIASGGSSGSGGTIASGGSSASGGKSGSGGASSTGGNSSLGGSGSGGNGSGGAGSGGTTAKGGSGGNGSGGTGTGGSGTGGGTCCGPTGGNGSGGPGTGGSATDGGSGTGGLPALTVNGTKLQDPSGKTIVLRGSSLIDIGTLYVNGSKSAKGITDRMDKIAAAGIAGHVVRLPVYPRNNVNAGYPFYSELPYPVGTAAPNNKATSGNTVIDMTAADYIAKVLKPAVDYAAGKNMYAIIDYHQIDDATKGQSADDATTFWTTVAPAFASYSNVLFEAFNEPIDGSATWATLKTVAKGWVDTIRKSAPNNVIIVSSNSYSQRPGDAASDPPPGSNLMFTAHPYPGNWNSTFKQQVATAVTKAPVFITEWGYELNGADANLSTSSTTYGTDFETAVDGYGASWTAWVTDNGWTPNLFSDSALTQLTDFGKVTKNWLTTKATSDWVQ